MSQKINDPSYSPTESQIAISFVDFIKKKFPQYVNSVIKIDNENKCSAYEGYKKKRMGKIKGASDYFISIPTKRYPGLWLEIKRDKGIVAIDQAHFINHQRKSGYAAMICYSIDECMDTFTRYVQGELI